MSNCAQVVIAKMQQITVKHFLPALGLPEALLRHHEALSGVPDISTEFFIAYRFGAPFG